VHRSAITYDPAYLEYDFGPSHPLRPERITAGLALLEGSGVLDRQSDLLRHAPATPVELRQVHDAAYVGAIEAASDGWMPFAKLAPFGLSARGDNPPFAGMHGAASAIAGGSLHAVRSIMRGDLDHAFNPAGGLHHAHRARASGFCLYNDPALAASAAVHEFGARVLYVDFDCHHGDGVQWIFYDDPRVLTISFHESGKYLFPSTGDVGEIGEGAGRGYSVNVPMQPYTRDNSWRSTIDAVLPDVAQRFQPDIIISAHGADTHVFDPLTHLDLTTESFSFQARLTHQLAHALAGGRWLALASGGYDWRRVVPRSWAILWAEMSGRTLPEELPLSWRRQWTAEVPIPPRYSDEGLLALPAGRLSEVERENQVTLDEVLALVS
jgi:acetoin utilization protein AcuC